MKSKSRFKLFTIVLCFVFINVKSELPCNVLVGYWQSSRGTDVRLNDINNNYIVNDDEIENLSIYPNPSTNELTLEITEINGEKAYIYNVYGQLVLEENIINKVTKIDIFYLIPGQYILKFSGISKVFIVQ